MGTGTWGIAAVIPKYLSLRLPLFERNVQAVDAEVHLAFACPEGTIAQAFYNNKFLKYNVDSWDEFKMLERVPRLVGKFREAVNKLIGRADSIEEKE